MKSTILFILFPFVLGLVSCHDHLLQQSTNNKAPAFEFIHDTLIQLTDLQPCDILVKPNHNWLYGTSLVEGGNGFGHAMLVVKGARGDSALDVLQKAVIFESVARKIPEPFQLRSVPAFANDADPRRANTTFGEQNAGFRYRLRFPLSPSQKDSIINFILQQDDGTSCWRSQKELNRKTAKKTWYCSLLIWEAFYQVLGVDLDANGGLMVFPNDLISSSYFNNTEDGAKRRVRF